MMFVAIIVVIVFFTVIISIVHYLDELWYQIIRIMVAFTGSALTLS